VKPIRINAGSNADWIDDTTGYTWIADKFFKGGWMYGSGLKSIGGTEQDTVYSSHRAGGGYSILVPPGQYTVILMFAEIYFEQKDSRIFTVSVQGQVVKSSLDVVAEAGPNNAYRISTIVVVGSTGKIDISLTAMKENTMISGIEIIPGATTFSPSSAPVFAPFKPIRINAGGPAWIDPITQFEWAADQYFDKGGGFSIDPSLIKGTSQNVLFASHRSFGGGFSSLGTYTIPVQQGLYTVNLMFAETFWTGIKDRLFNVIVQGNVVAKNLDLIEVAGEKTAYTLSTVATVTPVSQVNYIIIQMSNIINNGLISAIEILQYTPPPTSAPPTIPPIRINCGYNAPFEDAQGAIWAPDSNYTSGQTYSKVVADIFNTTFTNALVIQLCIILALMQGCTK
jgi:Malectin domain